MSCKETQNPENIVHEVEETSSSVHSLHDRDHYPISASPPPASPPEDLRQQELLNITNGGNKQSIELQLNRNSSIFEKDSEMLDITPDKELLNITNGRNKQSTAVQSNRNSSIPLVDSSSSITFGLTHKGSAAVSNPWTKLAETTSAQVSKPWIGSVEKNTPRGPRHGHKRNQRDDSSYEIDINEKEVNSYITCSVAEKFISLDSVVEKLMSLDDGVMVESQQKIQKVPFILRDNNFKKYYEPRVMAIGPYHHQNSNLKETENMKLNLAALFIQDYSLRKEVLYSKIKREIKYLRECYEEKAIKSFTDDDLAWIFFVDGCALLQYMYCYCACPVNEDTNWKFQNLKMKMDFLTIVQRDLFLLENQLPFRVLVLLISCMEREEQDEMMKSIESFILENIKEPGEEHGKEHKKRCQSENPIHLLDLLRTRLLEENQISCSRVHQLIKKFVEFMSEPIKNLMECFGKVFENCPCKQTKSLNSFRNVEELKAAGIRFRPSNTGRLTGITFSLGTLKLPSIVVDDFTPSKFMNLIAYEMSSDFLNDLGVSSYVVFLDTLIDQAQDVKELRDKKILYNRLGSDEEVANLFSEMGTNIVSNPEKYKDVKNGIQKRYGNKSMTWIAQLNHQYFQNPWSMIAFVAATVALALTVVQTIYSVWSFYK